ncbi:DUF4238 domain-containing protein [Bradyrhizobium barranii subsp. barranii]|uniref:DUF4238 domain-containing protein n=1 Tax=Bradyrhizobium barranii subsp. barranii TaxID=2823807 RepID=A0A939S4W7_9BRAD|nr:DUF4238 domain-containing protein [Bradyrhizobium barranii]UEM16719.1 DUF4238 domain-containing protein [Bradyrhizobium barranii subsp. barranii]
MGKSRNRPVKHHYVPQCYLRQFANTKGKAFQVSVFDREEQRSFKNNVKDVACQNYFNRIHLDGMDPNALESAMSEFESGLAEALVRIPRGSLQIPPGVVSQIPPPARQDKGLLV